MKRPDSNTREGRKWFTPSLGGGRGEAPAFTPLLALLAVFVLGSCTILDNDLRGLSDAPGFKSVVHEETDEYTCDYQYRPEVTYVDDYLAPYITSISEDYSTLYLADYIPDNYLPVPGELLASLFTDKLTYGMQHRVLSVTKGNGLYAVKLERAPLEDIFSSYVLESKDIYEDEFTDDYNAIETNNTEDLSAEGNNTAALSPRRRANGDDSYNVFTGVPAIDLNLAAFKAPNAKSMVNITGNLDLADVKVGFMPTLWPHYRVNAAKDEYDIGVNFGFNFELGLDYKGKGSITVDLCKLPVLSAIYNALNKKKTVLVGGGVPLTIEFKPGLDFDMSVNGGFSASLKTYKRWRVAYRTGIPGKEDGVYFETVKGSVDHDADVSGALDFTTQLKLSGALVVKIGAPGESMNVGIEIKLSAGPKLKAGLSSKSKNPYYNVLHFGIPFDLDGKGFLALTNNIKFEADFSSIWSGLLGNSNSTLYEFSPLDWRYYPSVDDLSITCRNINSWVPPIFDMKFSMKNLGLAFKKNEYKTVHPKVVVYTSSDVNISAFKDNADPSITATPVASHDFEQLKANSSYSWTLPADKMKRDITYYAVLYLINDAPKSGQSNIIYSQVYPFTTQSPSLNITDYNQTAQHYYFYKRSGVEHYYYDFKFRTDILPFGDVSDIKEWGIKVGDKVFTIKQPLSPKTSQVLWFIKKSNKGNRTLVLKPFVKSDINGVEMTNWGTGYTVNLKYDPSLNEGEDKFYQQTTEKDKDGKQFKADWYVRGYDRESDYSPVDFDMSSSTLRAPEVTMTPIEDGEDLPADTIDDNDYDDLEIEIVEVE